LASLERKVHVHFVQFQSRGYEHRDSRQAEVACRSGGTYTFVNRLDLSADGFDPALADAVMGARYAFLGAWRAVLRIDELASDQPWPQGAPAGRQFLLRGVVELKAPNPLMAKDATVGFDLMEGSGDKSPGRDLAVSVRKGCSGGLTCEPSLDDGGFCFALCGWESAICGPLLTRPLGSTCTHGPAGPGTCCLDECQALGEPCP
jgi:hypothetical protein